MDKLVVLLDRQNLWLSTSMVGRILNNLKHRGVLVESPPRLLTRRRNLRGRPWAWGKPRSWPIQHPGDLVQTDTNKPRRDFDVALPGASPVADDGCKRLSSQALDRNSKPG